jgi:hypothetical protein
MLESNSKPFLAQVLDERQLDTGIVYYGDMARVRSFMHKLRNQQPVHLGEDHSNGQPTTCASADAIMATCCLFLLRPSCEIRVASGRVLQWDCVAATANCARLSQRVNPAIQLRAAVVGGSISVGLGEDGFGPGVFRRVAAAFPNATHRFHNGALGGVTSTYMNSCLKWHVPPDVDLVIVSAISLGHRHPLHAPLEAAHSGVLAALYPHVYTGCLRWHMPLSATPCSFMSNCLDTAHLQ